MPQIQSRGKDTYTNKGKGGIRLKYVDKTDSASMRLFEV